MTGKQGAAPSPALLRVQSIALGMLAAGFLFVFFEVSFRGVDLLIDPVGFLIVSNALRPLQKMQPRFAGGWAASLALTAVSAVRLFAGGVPLLVLSLAQGVLQALLFAVLMRGFAALLAGEARKATARLMLVSFAVSALGCLASYFWGLGLLLGQTWVQNLVSTIFNVWLLVWLLVMFCLTEGHRARLQKKVQ